MKTKTKTKTKAKVLKLNYHRNGICGTPFYVAIVKEGESRKVIIRPSDCVNNDKSFGSVGCFVLDIDELNKNIIEFGKNSWRGDQYADLMDKAIAKKEKENKL